MRIRFMHRLLILSALLGMPLPAYGAGGADISNIFVNLITAFAPLWGFIAFTAIVVAGLTLLLSQDEGAIDKAKKTVIAVMVGGIITVILLFFPGGPRGVVLSFFSPVFSLGVNTFNFSADPIGLEAEGVAGWLTGMAAMIGIVVIIIAALKAVTSFGADEGAYTKVRGAILQGIIGLIVIGGAFIFKNVFFFNREPSALIALVTSKILIVLFFITTLAVGILVYAGFRMVLSFGREEDFTAAKSLVIRVFVGLLVIILSFAMVFIVRTLF